MSLRDIDILIGADFIWKLVATRNIKQLGDLRAFNSSFDWLLSGEAEEYPTNKPTNKQVVNTIAAMLTNCVSSNVKFIDATKNGQGDKAVTFPENSTEFIPPPTSKNVTSNTESGVVTNLTKEAGGVPATLGKDLTSQGFAIRITNQGEKMSSINRKVMYKMYDRERDHK